MAHASWQPPRPLRGCWRPPHAHARASWAHLRRTARQGDAGSQDHADGGARRRRRCVAFADRRGARRRRPRHVGGQGTVRQDPPRHGRRLDQCDHAQTEDQPWVPRALRDGATDLLDVLFAKAGVYRPLAPTLVAFMDATGSRAWFDLCSGGGGGVLAMRADLVARGAGPADVTLSDRHPHDVRRSAPLPAVHRATHPARCRGGAGADRVRRRRGVASAPQNARGAGARRRTAEPRRALRDGADAGAPGAAGSLFAGPVGVCRPAHSIAVCVGRHGVRAARTRRRNCWHSQRRCRAARRTAGKPDVPDVPST